MKLSLLQKSRIKQLAQAFGLNLVILFGSQARGNIHSQSDFDLAVRGKRPFSLKQRLKLAVEFDSVLKGECDLSDIRGASPLLLAAIAQDGQPLFEEKAGDFAQFKLSAINQYLDFKPWLDRIARKNDADIAGLKI